MRLLILVITAIAALSVRSFEFGANEDYDDGLISYPNIDYESAAPQYHNFLESQQDRMVRHPNDNGVRFGWQNPIRVAPTLSPSGHSSSYRQPPRKPDPPTSEHNPRPGAGGHVCTHDSRRSRETGQCQTLGSRGSCSENMAFYAEPTNDEFGQCDCIQEFNRPLVFHPKSGKCYFIFQQAYCQKGEWLILQSRQDSETVPVCQRNTCTGFASSTDPNYNWNSNGHRLDKFGTVALLNERHCTWLGWPCVIEGRGRIKELLAPERVTGSPESAITVKFDGDHLVCGESSREALRSQSLVCKLGLLNKWRLDGHCSDKN